MADELNSPQREVLSCCLCGTPMEPPFFLQVLPPAPGRVYQYMCFPCAYAVNHALKGYTSKEETRKRRARKTAGLVQERIPGA
jgi:hypothetical protein